MLVEAADLVIGDNCDKYDVSSSSLNAFEISEEDKKDTTRHPFYSEHDINVMLTGDGRFCVHEIEVYALEFAPKKDDDHEYASKDEHASANDGGHNDD